MPIHELTVALGERSYPIRIGTGLLADAAALRAGIRGRQVLLLSNRTVAPLYADLVEAALSDLRWQRLELDDGEQFKTLASAQRIWEALAEMGAQRDACLMALGGGVIGDLGGYAAAGWMRGIDFVQLPTTLLAMVDSSVGGKTGVNLPQGKNLVGAFWQPRAVHADISTLTTLPEREYLSGLAEVVKYAAIADLGFFVWLEQQAGALRDREPVALAEAVLRSCQHKAAIVARDEREQGERALLNFGHTYAHALETLGEYKDLLHGEAVAVGMVLAATLSAQLGMSDAAASERLIRLLLRLGLPVSSAHTADAEAIVNLMRLDKKTLSDRLRLILWRGIGRAEVVDGVPEAAIVRALQG